jgi:GT2 family glycosyltransferase
VHLVHRPTNDPALRVDASIVVVTRDRVSEALRAVASALSQEDCATEVIVIDDGSHDGTAETISCRLPGAWVYRAPVSRGYIAERNFAASVARGEFLFSLDDDAELTNSGTVAATLRDFDSEDIGAVAIPYWEVTGERADLRFSRLGRDRVEVAGHFHGCAYAIQRELFLCIGGFGEHLFHMGEERDLAVRMLQAGYFIRLGSTSGIAHRPSRTRQPAMNAFYARRNDVLFAWQRVPVYALPGHLLRLTGGALLAMISSNGRPHARAMLRGFIQGWRDSRWVQRVPLDPGVYRLSLRLRRKGPMDICEARARLRRPLGSGGANADASGCHV